MFGPLLSNVCMRGGMRGRLFGWLPPPPPPPPLPPPPPPPPLRPLFRLFWPGLMIPLKSRYDIIHDICDWCECSSVSDRFAVSAILGRGAIPTPEGAGALGSISSQFHPRR